MRIAIHQPNFAPWCGYFAKIAAVDTFVLLDDVQMSKNSYTNRSQVLSGNMKKWLTVPVSFSFGEPISVVKTAQGDWVDKHLSVLGANYSSAACYKEVMPMISSHYLSENWGNLSQFNIGLIKKISDYLGLATKFVVSSSINHSGASDDRLISIVKLLGGKIYISGKGGQNYQDPEKFASAGINLDVREYRPVQYVQTLPGFIPGLSVFDALFNLGKAAKDLLVYNVNQIGT